MQLTPFLENEAGVVPDFQDFIIAVGYGNISDKTMDLCVQKLSSA